ncbi:cyclic nucleotide-binding domain-containing protein [Piscinibacter sp. XHJ-5]|uniref:Crp/Fnr family transcriptional regulator n=1 Tax=Piscinibacter sp. XHJ-5 TaxID=3037797 RepID=UPI002452DE26|nr:cyclic nucleotide-binding domain-containing protein [Piscinibacter sp. XHJ-5]
MQTTRVELLQGMPIFGAIREDILRFLLDQARSVSIHAGEFFFHEGDAATGMYVLEQGRVAVLKHWKGQSFLLRELAEGDCFGEMALMDLMPRSASVRALEDCSAIEIRSAHLHALYRQDVEQFALVQMNMGREVSRRLRAAVEQLFRNGMEAATDASASVARDLVH